MTMNAKVVSTNISSERGTIKKPVPEINIDKSGVIGDAHAGSWHRQVSILSRELIDDFGKQMNRKLNNGEFAENITTEGIDLQQLGPMDHLVIGDVELQVSQTGKECHGDKCAIFREVGKCVMPKEGIFCKVIRGGTICAGAPIRHIPRELKILIITVSDRASRGEYEDRSGPQVKKHLDEFFAKKRWHPKMETYILPDEPTAIHNKLGAFRKTAGDVIILTGGTGIGPRDITPEVVLAFCDKTIPGIMESIRMKYGAEKPNALLSRSIAGVKDSMLIYAIPGSVRAVDEYMSEILKSFEHAFLMMHAIDVH